MIRRFLMAAGLAATLAAPSGAQVRGRVVDAAGLPVSGATVALWMDEHPAGSTRTGERGEFAIATPLTHEALIVVRRLGLRTRAVRVPSADAFMLVRMEAEPVSLLPLTVQAAPRPPCPNREDPRARALWERMRARYWRPDADSVFVFGFVESRSGTGRKEDAWDPAAGRPTSGWTFGSLIVAHPHLMRRAGYASRADGGPGERTASWLYRALDQGAIQDFTGDFFGEAHTLSLVHQGAERTTLAFCPRERLGRTGQILGTLELAPDTTLRLARWTFRTPAPDEDAGGEASYDPPDAALGRALLTRESIFWRRTNRPRYWFEAHRFSGWQRWTRDRPITHPDDARPAPPEPR